MSGWKLIWSSTGILGFQTITGGFETFFFSVCFENLDFQLEVVEDPKLLFDEIDLGGALFDFGKLFVTLLLKTYLFL